MSSLTVFVMKNDTPAFSKPQRLEDSLGKVKGVDINIVHMDDRRLDLIEVETDWWMYMFDNEYLDPSMIRVLATYCDTSTYDFFQMYQRMIVYEKIDGKDKARAKTFLSPRLFRKHVYMEEGDSFIPVDIEGILIATNILDGWIVRD
jgi:hypothetical protein